MTSNPTINDRLHARLPAVAESICERHYNQLHPPNGTQQDTMQDIDQLFAQLPPEIAELLTNLVRAQWAVIEGLEHRIERLRQLLRLHARLQRWSDNLRRLFDDPSSSPLTHPNVISGEFGVEPRAVASITSTGMPPEELDARDMEYYNLYCLLFRLRRLVGETVQHLEDSFWLMHPQSSRYLDAQQRLDAAGVMAIKIQVKLILQRTAIEELRVIRRIYKGEDLGEDTLEFVFLNRHEIDGVEDYSYDENEMNDLMQRMAEKESEFNERQERNTKWLAEHSSPKAMTTRILTSCEFRAVLVGVAIGTCIWFLIILPILDKPMMSGC